MMTLDNAFTSASFDIKPDDSRTIVDVFDKACCEFSERKAFSCMGKNLTFAELDRLSGQFASYLQHHSGLKAGDRVAVQLPNVLQFPVVMFGVLRAGMVLVTGRLGSADRHQSTCLTVIDFLNNPDVRGLSDVKE